MTRPGYAERQISIVGGVVVELPGENLTSYEPSTWLIIEPGSSISTEPSSEVGKVAVRHSDLYGQFSARIGEAIFPDLY